MLRIAERAIRRWLGPDVHARAAAAFYDVAYRLPQWQHLSTLNYGYAPVHPDIARAAPNEAHQIQLYAEVLAAVRSAAGRGFAPRVLLEICCGRGGGLAYARDMLAPACTIGVDRAMPALRYAAARDPSIHFVRAHAPRLPFASGSVDLALNVEAFNPQPMSAFLAEVSRIIAPGGYFVITDSLMYVEPVTRDVLLQCAKEHGFSLDYFRDITENIHQSCVADESRRRHLTDLLPRYYRPFAREFVCLPGSPRFRQFANRERCYFIAVLRPSGS